MNEERPVVLRNNLEIEDEPEEEDPEEEDSKEDPEEDTPISSTHLPCSHGGCEETSSISTLSRPEVSTALKRLPEIILAAQQSEELERQLNESRRENLELKRQNAELRRREMQLADEVGRTKRELQIRVERMEAEKKTAKEELIQKSKLIEATQKAEEFLELSSSIFKIKH